MPANRVKELLARSACIEVLAELVNIDPMTLNSSSRIDYLAALEKQGAWLQALMQLAIVAVAGAEPTLDRGTFSGVDDPQREEIASTLNLAPVTAQSRIDVARVLTQHLPATCSALANGEISSAQATVIAKESATLLRRGIDPDQLKYLESEALSYSEFHTPAQVTHKVRSLVAKMDPVEFEVEVAEAKEGRRVTLTPQPHGMAQILALLPAIEAQTIWLAIDKLARANREKQARSTNSNAPDQTKLVSGVIDSGGPASTGTASRPSTSLESAFPAPTTSLTDSAAPTTSLTDSAAPTAVAASFKTSVDFPPVQLPDFMRVNNDPLTLDQLRADAFAQIAGEFLAETKDDNLAHGRPVTLNLTLDLPTFLGLKDNPGLLAGYGEIPASAARLLATDAKWKRFITDPITGNLMDYGRLTYEPPQPLVDFIVARDRRCRFPGCRQPARICDIDHAIAWEDGGRTSKENLGLLCRRHHRMKTHGGWKLLSYDDGSCQWTSPAGKVFHVAARRVDELA